MSSTYDRDALVSWRTQPFANYTDAAATARKVAYEHDVETVVRVQYGGFQVYMPYDVAVMLSIVDDGEQDPTESDYDPVEDERRREMIEELSGYADQYAALVVDDWPYPD